MQILLTSDSVTSIGSNDDSNGFEGAFDNNNLTSVDIPNSVVYIGYYAFANNNLTSVTIPNSVDYIYDGAFNSNNLASVTIPNSVTTIEPNTFDNNNLTSVTIPGSVTSIGSYAFSNNYLASIIIPNSVDYIGSYAFESNKLTNATILANEITIEYNIFDDNLDLKIYNSSSFDFCWQYFMNYGHEVIIYNEYGNLMCSYNNGVTGTSTY